MSGGVGIFVKKFSYWCQVSDHHICDANRKGVLIEMYAEDVGRRAEREEKEAQQVELEAATAEWDVGYAKVEWEASRRVYDG